MVWTVLMAGQFHFDPGTYLSMVRAEVPDYDTVQEIVARAADAVVAAEAILDLGTGTGETLRRVGRVTRTRGWWASTRVPPC